MNPRASSRCAKSKAPKEGAGRAPHLVDLASPLFGPEHGVDLILPARSPARPVRFEDNGRRRRPAAKEV